MEKIKINKKQLLEFQKQFTYLFGRINNQGDGVAYNSMIEIKENISNTEKVIIDELFEIGDNDNKIICRDCGRLMKFTGGVMYSCKKCNLIAEISYREPQKIKIFKR